MIRHFFRSLRRHSLHVHLPLRGVTALNGVVQIALMTVPILRNSRCCLCVGQVFNTLLRTQVALHPVAFALLVPEAVGVRTKPMHVTVGSWNTAVTHNNSYLVERLR